MGDRALGVLAAISFRSMYLGSLVIQDAQVHATGRFNDEWQNFVNARADDAEHCYLCSEAINERTG